MQNISDIFSQLPLKHHAYGVESYTQKGDEILSCFPKGAFEYVFQKEYERMGIDDVRELKTLQSEKTAGSSLFILDISVIGVEAQNALLKILEEPSTNTFFILIVPRLDALLETLRSRLELLVCSDIDNEEKGLLSAQHFLNMNLVERFEYIKNILDSKKEPSLEKRDVFIFITELEKYLLEKGIRDAIITTLYHSKEYLSSNAASMKMILENIAIQLEHKYQSREN